MGLRPPRAPLFHGGLGHDRLPRGCRARQARARPLPQGGRLAGRRARRGRRARGFAQRHHVGKGRRPARGRGAESPHRGARPARRGRARAVPREHDALAPARRTLSTVTAIAAEERPALDPRAYLGSMWRHPILRAALKALLTVVVATAITFSLIRLLPGNPIDLRIDELTR